MTKKPKSRTQRRRGLGRKLKLLALIGLLLGGSGGASGGATVLRFYDATGLGSLTVEIAAESRNPGWSLPGFELAALLPVLALAGLAGRQRRAKGFRRE